MWRVNQVIQNQSHAFWVFLQQFLIRVVVGVKFLFIARLLGPESVGLISIALVSLAFIEAVTELGFMQAIVTREKELNATQENTIWTVQLIRGLIICLVLICSAELIENIFNVKDASKVIYVLSIVPLLRNAISVGVYKSQRNQNFRIIALLQVITIFFDFLFTIIFIIIFKNAMSAIFAMVISEIFKLILSHILLKTSPKLEFKFNEIKDINSYGKWIWANSISTLLFSQLDKVLASRYLGVTVLGLYQTSQKFSQMAIYDTSNPIGQYLFPILSRTHREKKNQLPYLFFISYSILLTFSVLTTAVLYSNADIIINLILGNKWKDMVVLFKIMVIGQSLASIVNICIVYLRAIGKPNIVTLNSYIQLLIVAVFSFLGVRLYGVNGLIYASIIGYVITNLVLTLICLKQIKQIITSILIEGVRILAAVAVLIVFRVVISDNIYYLLVSVFIYCIYMFYFIVRTNRYQKITLAASTNIDFENRIQIPNRKVK
ncbi:oligosaccharide flippase family protein [Bacillus sp. S34]|nr:oligosaccharide flippase family protein [Bacillus sp. S34]